MTRLKARGVKLFYTPLAEFDKFQEVYLDIILDYIWNQCPALVRSLSQASTFYILRNIGGLWLDRSCWEVIDLFISTQRIKREDRHKIT